MSLDVATETLYGSSQTLRQEFLPTFVPPIPTCRVNLRIRITCNFGNPTVSVTVWQRQRSLLRWIIRRSRSSCQASRRPGRADDEFQDDYYDFDWDWSSPRATSTTRKTDVIAPAVRRQGGVIEVPCHACRGRGYLPCPLCDLAPHRSCELCAGAGKVDCSACNGSRVEVISKRGAASEVWDAQAPGKFVTVAEDEQLERSLVLPPPKPRKKADKRPELSAETRMRMSLAVRRHEQETGIRAQRIREAMADPQRWEQRNASIRATKRSPAKREEAAEMKRRHFSDPANRHKQSNALKGAVFYCSSCSQEGHRAPFCPQNGYVPPHQRPPPRPYTCGRCGVQGHSSARCPLRPGGALVSAPPRCSICREEGHNRQSCPNKREEKEEGVLSVQAVRRKGGRRPRYRCGLCGEEGHQRRTCPRSHSQGRVEGGREEEEKEEKAGPRGGELEIRSYICGWCGEVGHSKRSCPLKKRANT